MPIERRRKEMREKNREKMIIITFDFWRVHQIEQSEKQDTKQNCKWKMEGNVERSTQVNGFDSIARRVKQRKICHARNCAYELFLRKCNSVFRFFLSFFFKRFEVTLHSIYLVQTETEHDRGNRRNRSSSEILIVPRVWNFSGNRRYRNGFQELCTHSCSMCLCRTRSQDVNQQIVYALRVVFSGIYRDRFLSKRLHTCVLCWRSDARSMQWWFISMYLFLKIRNQFEQRFVHVVYTKRIPALHFLRHMYSYTGINLPFISRSLLCCVRLRQTR